MKSKKTENRNSIWLGWGGPWDQYEAQLCYDLMKRNTKVLQKKQKPLKGLGFIQGLLEKEDDIYLDLSKADGHVLISGGSGAGKTVFLQLIICQLIMRNKSESLIILDPKGDQDLRKICKETCAIMGEPERYIELHPAYPESSVRINPLKNYNRTSEITSRVTSLLPTDGDSFYREIAASVVQMLVDGMVFIDEQVSLAKIKYYYQHFGLLIYKSILRHCENNGFDWMSDISGKLQKEVDDDKKAMICVNYYRSKVELKSPNDNITSLCEMYVEKKKLLEQSTANLINNLNTLTTGSMKELLSPSDVNDPRPSMDMQSVIDSGRVLFIGTDSLADLIVSQSIGKMFISDLISIGANNYNFEDMKKTKKINVMIDEVAEVLSPQLITGVNKGRGGNLRMWLICQSISDFVAVLGTEAEKEQFIASTVNYISFRAKDASTQEQIGISNPKTKVRYVMRTQGFSASNDNLESLGTNLGERLMEEEVESFPVELMAKLPDLEYIATFAGGGLIKGRIPILGKDKRKK